MGKQHVRVVLDGDRVVGVLPPDGAHKSNWAVAVAAIVAFGLVVSFLWLLGRYPGPL